METVRLSRGDTSIVIRRSFLGAGGAAPVADEDPSVLFDFRVCLVLCSANEHVYSCDTSFVSTLGAISAELSRSGDLLRDRGFSAPILHWLPEISATAQEASRARASFRLYAHIHLHARYPMFTAALAIKAGLVLSPDGVLVLTGGEGLRTVLFSGRGTCTICMEEMAKGAAVARLDCSHAFHGACLYRWLQTKVECPLCRKSFCTHEEGGE